MQQLYQREILFEEQQVYELNPLYNFIYNTRPPLRNLTTVSGITVRNTYLQEDTGITLIPNVSKLIRLESMILTFR